MIKLAFTDTRFGELCIDTGKIEIDDTLWTPILLSLFGGNIEADTQQERQPVGAENLDWFGNVFLAGIGAEKYNSSFERVLVRTPFTSAGFSEYERAVLQDLDWLVKAKILGKIDVTFQIQSATKIAVTIEAEKPNGLPATYEFLWRKR